MNISTVRLRSVLLSTESDSAVSCPQQSQTPQCPALSRVRLRSVLPSAESDSTVSCPQQSQTPQCPALNRVRLRSVLSSTEPDFAVSCPQQSQTSRCPLPSLSHLESSCILRAYQPHILSQTVVPRCQLVSFYTVLLYVLTSGVPNVAFGYMLFGLMLFNVVGRGY